MTNLLLNLAVILLSIATVINTISIRNLTKELKKWPNG